MFKVGIVTLAGTITSRDFKTREEVDDYILTMDNLEQVTRYRIELNGKLIETEKGRIE